MSSPIGRLVHAYADAVCHCDVERWQATWAPDSVWDMGALRLEGRDEIAHAWTLAMARYDQVIQLVYNGAVDLDAAAGTGTGRWYIVEYLKPSADTPKLLLAYYDDDYVNRDDDWLFAVRRLTHLYSGPPDLSGEFAGPPASPGVS